MNKPIYLATDEARLEVERWYQSLRYTWGDSQTLVYLSPYSGGPRMGLNASIMVPCAPQATIIYPICTQDTSLEIETAKRMGIIGKSRTYRFIGDKEEFLALIKRTWYEIVGELNNGEAKEYAHSVFSRAVAENTVRV